MRLTSARLCSVDTLAMRWSGLFLVSHFLYFWPDRRTMEHTTLLRLALAIVLRLGRYWDIRCVVMLREVRIGIIRHAIALLLRLVFAAMFCAGQSTIGSSILRIRVTWLFLVRILMIWSGSCMNYVLRCIIRIINCNWRNMADFLRCPLIRCEVIIFAQQLLLAIDEFRAALVVLLLRWAVKKGVLVWRARIVRLHGTSIHRQGVGITRVGSHPRIYWSLSIRKKHSRLVARN